MSELLERQQELSIQPRAESSNRGFSMHLLDGLIASGQLAPGWWSPSRDAFLRRFITQSDHVSSAINSMCARLAAIPSHIEARDPTVKAHRKLADYYNIIWNETSDFGRGKSELIFKYARDWYGQDNGTFLEIIGDGSKDGPIEGMAMGIANLDAAKCSRTGDPTYPVVYDAGNDGKYRLHYTRVAFASSMPSNREDMYGVGYCAVSRCLNNAQRLIDQDVYYQEKMGSRPKRQILITQGGLDPDDVSMAFQMADRSMDNQQLSRFSKAVLLGDSTIPDGNIISVDLASIPDGFDQQTSTTLGMFAIAMAFGVPVRWLWPASSAGATKADAMFQHIAGQGPGVGHFLTVLTNMLGGSPRGELHLTGKFLPPTLRIVFDFQDDDQDRQVAENKKIRVEGWEKHLQNQTMDVRVVREQMLRAGDLTDDQFRRLELEDGRLPDGRDVLSLFSDTSPLMLQLLDLSVTNPLAIEANDPADMILEINAAALETQDMIVNAPSTRQKQEAELALAALGKLKGIYEQILTEEIQQEQIADQEAQAQETPQEELPEDETKQFNFGASVGQIIRGKLARGAGGKFVNVEDLKAKLQQDILDRLRARQGAEGLTEAELKRLENREAVLELLGGKIDGDDFDALVGLRSGEQPTREQIDSLKAAGLLTEFEDGSVAMTAGGRSLMRAANAGDVDAAVSAIGKAKPKPKGGKGKAPKKTPEDRERERQAELQENRAVVSEALSDTLSPDAYSALQEFRDGVGDLREHRTSLAQNGLVEFDSDGNARLTSGGRAVLSAGDKADVRSATDALSRAREKVAQTEQRANEALDRAEGYDNRIAELESSIDPESKQ